MGQEQLHNLAEDLLVALEDSNAFYVAESVKKDVCTLRSRLELDGYVFKDNHLLTPESDVLDTQEESGVLESLYVDLELDSKDTAFHHLALSEEHYRSQKWDDSISNSRKFLECTLAEVGRRHAAGVGAPNPVDWSRPVVVRDYLESSHLLETKEKEALAKVYGLLSATGSHPYMASHDQARLLRHLALTFSQFVLLRYSGSRKK